MSKYLHNIEEISRLSMTERLKLWKQARADKAKQETASSSGGRKALYERFQTVSSNSDKKSDSVGDKQNYDPNNFDEQKVKLKKKVKRSQEGKPVLHNLSPSSALELQTRDERRRSSLGAL